MTDDIPGHVDRCRARSSVPGAGSRGSSFADSWSFRRTWWTHFADANTDWSWVPCVVQVINDRGLPLHKDTLRPRSWGAFACHGPGLCVRTGRPAFCVSKPAGGPLRWDPIGPEGGTTPGIGGLYGFVVPYPSPELYDVVDPRWVLDPAYMPLGHGPFGFTHTELVDALELCTKKKKPSRKRKHCYRKARCTKNRAMERHYTVQDRLETIASNWRPEFCLSERHCETPAPNSKTCSRAV